MQTATCSSYFAAAPKPKSLADEVGAMFDQEQQKGADFSAPRW
jgi:hypothetical protein